MPSKDAPICYRLRQSPPSETLPAPHPFLACARPHSLTAGEETLIERATSGTASEASHRTRYEDTLSR